MLIKDTKVYAVLSKFDRYEQNRCRKYIQSPYFNINKQLNQLYEIIINDINKPPKKLLTKPSIWKKLYDPRKYDDTRFRKLSSDLLKLVEGYLAQQFYDSQPLIPATNLIKSVERKKIHDLYDTSIRSAKNISHKNKSLSAIFFYQQYKIEDYIFEVIDYESKRDTKSNYEDIMYNLDQFFLSEKLRLYCGVLSRRHMSVHEYSINFIKEVLAYVENNLNHVAKNVEIYYRIYLTYTDEDNVENYYSLKKLLNEFSASFQEEEAYHLYLQVINFCIKRIQNGMNDFWQEMFDISVDMISKNIIYENGLLSPSVFKNVMTVATRLEKFKWAENFIRDNKEKLPKEHRENMVSFNLARLHFMQKNYNKVIELLREVEYSDISLSLQSKSFLLMTYYDIEEIEPLDSLLESFRVYLNRHKEIPQPRRVYHKNLIKFTKKLTKVIPGDKAAVAKIKQEIEDTEGFRVKWLEEKIAELEG